MKARAGRDQLKARAELHEERKSQPRVRMSGRDKGLSRACVRSWKLNAGPAVGTAVASRVWPAPSRLRTSRCLPPHFRAEMSIQEMRSPLRIHRDLAAGEQSRARRTDAVQQRGDQVRHRRCGLLACGAERGSLPKRKAARRSEVRITCSKADEILRVQ